MRFLHAFHKAKKSCSAKTYFLSFVSNDSVQFPLVLEGGKKQSLRTTSFLGGLCANVHTYTLHFFISSPPHSSPQLKIFVNCLYHPENGNFVCVWKNKVSKNNCPIPTNITFGNLPSALWMQLGHSYHQSYLL